MVGNSWFIIYVVEIVYGFRYIIANIWSWISRISHACRRAGQKSEMFLERSTFKKPLSVIGDACCSGSRHYIWCIIYILYIIHTDHLCMYSLMLSSPPISIWNPEIPYCVRVPTRSQGPRWYHKLREKHKLRWFSFSGWKSLETIANREISPQSNITIRNLNCFPWFSLWKWKSPEFMFSTEFMVGPCVHAILCIMWQILAIRSWVIRYQ